MRVTSHLVKVWTITKVSPRLQSYGCLSKFGMLRRATRLKSAISGPYLSHEIPTLIDFNDRKATKAEILWGKVNFLNPYSLNPSNLERILLLVAVALPLHLARAMQVYALCLNLRRRVEDLDRVVLWNPYSPFHHAVSNLFDIEDCYILAPLYPLVDRCGCYTGLWPIREIYGLDRDRFRELDAGVPEPGGKFFFSIHLTKLTFVGDGESALIKFASFLLQLGVPVEVYLHPADRGATSWPKLPLEVQSTVVRRPSLDHVGERQISLSSISTVGLELHARGTFHFFFCGLEPRTEFVDWTERIGRRVDPAAEGAVILDRVRAALRSERPDLDAELSWITRGQLQHGE